ncbi:translation initiation factor IF-2-like [Vitis riparia]|uniref:translation initiation factor IF-2-like n=1 Tax=Vitis riparia TaxID=96939 RepID=UPI00155A2AC9|nr:translation initiation factor IF-2-like [Vitis riparia]
MGSSKVIGFAFLVLFLLDLSFATRILKEYGADGGGGGGGGGKGGESGGGSAVGAGSGYGLGSGSRYGGADGHGYEVEARKVEVAEEVAAVGEVEPHGLDQATVQDMDPVLVTDQELEGGKVTAAVVVPVLVQGFVFLIGMEMQVAEAEVAVAKTLREVHHLGMDQAMVEEGTEAGEEKAMEVKLVQDPDPDRGEEVDRDMGQDTAVERMVHPEVEETTN